MPYKFNFDLSHLSQSFFKEVAKFSNRRNLHREIGDKVQYLVEKFKIEEVMGLNISDALKVVEDLLDIYIKNLSEKERFLKTSKRALFLPHCSRKFMDNRCQAHFDPEVPSYYCAHCSQDCLINQATNLAKKRGYDVYVIPGSSCIPKLIKNYEGIIGVACCEELRLGMGYLKRDNIRSQGIFLVKNGCAATRFNIDSLKTICEPVK